MTEQMQSEVAVDFDDFLGQLARITADEYERSSHASETAAKTKEFLELTQLNSQAMSWAKSIYKKLPKKDGEVKAMDVIRSLEILLPMLKNHIEGQQPALPIDAEADSDDDDDDTDIDPSDEDDEETVGEDVMPDDEGDDDDDETVVPLNTTAAE